MQGAIARLFIALEINPELTAAIVKFIHKLDSTQPPIRWVPTNNLHLTLAFLGDVPVERAGLLEPLLKRVAESAPAFELNLNEWGAFPDLKRPTVFWLGNRQQVACRALKTALDQALISTGFECDQRDFFAHVTLGRLKRGARFKWPTNWKSQVTLPPSAIQTLVLYQSQLDPTGARYAVLKREPLRKNV